MLGSVFNTIVIVTVGMVTPLVYLWGWRKMEAKARERLRSVIDGTATRCVQTNNMPLEQHYVEGVGYLIGDISCKFNARSPYMRCAVNPIGPCQECPYYQQTE